MFDAKEKEALFTLAENFKALLLKTEEVRKSKVLLDLFLVNEYCYAVDLKTSTIIWANENVKRQFGRNVEGKKCYEVLQGFIENCPFCKVSEARQHPGTPEKWVHRNYKTNQVFLVEDTYLPNGFNGYKEPAHFERAIDITDLYVDIIREFSNA